MGGRRERVWLSALCYHAKNGRGRSSVGGHRSDQTSGDHPFDVTTVTAFWLGGVSRSSTALLDPRANFLVYKPLVRSLRVCVNLFGASWLPSYSKKFSLEGFPSPWFLDMVVISTTDRENTKEGGKGAEGD